MRIPVWPGLLLLLALGWGCHSTYAQRRDQGMHYFKKKQPIPALDELEQANRMPEAAGDALLRYILAQCYLQTGQLEAAFEQARQAVQLTSQASAALARLREKAKLEPRPASSTLNDAEVRQLHELLTGPQLQAVSPAEQAVAQRIVEQSKLKPGLRSEELEEPQVQELRAAITAIDTEDERARALLERLRKGYGPLILKKDPRQRLERGYIYLELPEQGAGLISEESKQVFNAIRDRLATQPVESGTMVYLPYGEYLATGTRISFLPARAPTHLPFHCDGDQDCDQAPDATDNCVAMSNASQRDEDQDRLGDVCDRCPQDPENDADQDLICGDVDNCRQTPNREQIDTDADKIGDACDPDRDNDGKPNEQDNCPLTYNPDQADEDQDQIGNLCEGDLDGDLVPDREDNCPEVANPPQSDRDGDRVGDECDVCPNDRANDADGDGVCEQQDNCPAQANPFQTDTDQDRTGDVCDRCPRDANDDADGDRVCAEVDNCPFQANAEQTDTDQDRVGDRCDNCRWVPNAEQADADGNGFGDACDKPDDDADQDGIPNGTDNCWKVPNPEQTDGDGDRIGDACEEDRPLVGASVQAVLLPEFAVFLDGEPRIGGTPWWYWAAGGVALVGAGVGAVLIWTALQEEEETVYQLRITGRGNP